MKAVIYARYSSDNQTEASIEGQIRECLEYANRVGLTVIGQYIDRALSAKTDNRPEFQCMIRDSNKHCFDVILVWKLDRFARNRYDSAYYKNMLKKNGVKVVSARETIAEGSEGILLEAVLEGYAEFFSAELSEKVIRGLKENALKCKVNGSSIPFGYNLNAEQKLEIDPTTAPIVEEIFQMYADGKTIKQIVVYLNERHILTKRGNPMTINRVTYMLKNRKYIGEYKYMDIVIPNGVPKIVDEQLFDRVQEMLQKNKKAPACHKAEDDYLLTTKLFCGKCGSYMVGESGTSKTKDVHHYYKCAKAKKHECDKKTVRKDWIENIAVKKALEILNDDEIIAYLIDRIYELQAEDNPRLPRLQEQLADINKKINNMLNAIEEGVLLPSTKDRLAELEQKRSDTEVAILQEQIQKPTLSKEQLAFVFEKFRNMDVSTKESKERLINTFINAIYLYDDEITLLFNFRDGTQTVSLAELESSDFNGFGAPK